MNRNLATQEISLPAHITHNHLASTGIIDINDVKFVVNFDFPGQIEDYVHRIGRTARGKDAKGTSYTFFTQGDGKVIFIPKVKNSYPFLARSRTCEPPQGR